MIWGRSGFDLMYDDKQEHAEVGQLASLKADRKIKC